MSHFAEIDSNNQVLRVIVANSKEWCEQRLGGTWVQTSYNGNIRKNYAGIGYIYDQALDAFVPPQPVYNYILDLETANWVFPDDNHLYIPTASHLALPLSKALYKIIEPTKDGLYAGIISHQEDTQYMLLQCRNTDIIPISLEADTLPLIEALQPTVEDGAITQQELDGIVQAVSYYAGQVVKIQDFIPESWRPRIMDKQQAIDAGYLI